MSPRILFFSINGSGLGHLSRCLAYARRMSDRARPVFFSLASAIEVIQDFGFEADYFVSPFWSRSHHSAWNRELVARFGLMLEEVQPRVVVFDGTWPFPGFLDACEHYGAALRVWSNRGLHKPDFAPVPIGEHAFDLVIQPGEIGTRFAIERAGRPGRKIATPPVTLLRSDELLGRHEARQALGLALDGRYALLSLGPGNLKDIGDIGIGLIRELRGRGFETVWARTPITVNDVSLPEGVIPITVFPLVRYMQAFDIFAGAAGYNTCCEVLQSGVPSLLVPNRLVADDQARRAAMLAHSAPVVVSACETPDERAAALDRLLEIEALPGFKHPEVSPALDGAEHAAREILALAEELGATP